MLCVTDVHWQELSDDFLELVVYMFGKYFRDAVDRANDRAGLNVLLMDFVDAINLGYTCLLQVSFCHCLFKIDFFGFRWEEVTHVGIDFEEFVSVFLQFASHSPMGEKLIVLFIQ